MAIWTAIDPPTVHLMKTVDNTAEYQCNTDNITFWVIFLVAKGAWLIFGAVLSVLTRNIAKEYNESSSIAYAVSLSSLFSDSLIVIVSVTVL